MQLPENPNIFYIFRLFVTDELYDILVEQSVVEVYIRCWWSGIIIGSAHGSAKTCMRDVYIRRRWYHEDVYIRPWYSKGMITMYHMHSIYSRIFESK